MVVRYKNFAPEVLIPHTTLSNEVRNFVLPQAVQKLSAKVAMSVSLYSRGKIGKYP